VSIDHVGHNELLLFADAQVNLKKSETVKRRKQVNGENGLRERLKSHIKEHPDFSLKKMIMSGSLAKGTALKSSSDIDVAVYIEKSDTPQSNDELSDWLADKIREMYPQMSDDQIRVNNYSVSVHFNGTGLDVDLVPIKYDGDENWRGDLVSNIDGSILETSIPLHLEFIRNRKESDNRNLAQVAQFLKYWSVGQKRENPNFRCKSFMLELLLIKLIDEKRIDIGNYPVALMQFFDAIVCGLLDDPIYFNDYYCEKELPDCDDPIRIFDPVNPNNNVASAYSQVNLDCFYDSALAAGDAIATAHRANTKSKSIAAWRQVFGDGFSF
jgi:tRNA nucleotidyltransferase (CCA-adding enzyme)